jgi:hypothetical protein
VMLKMLKAWLIKNLQSNNTALNEIQKF